MIWFTDWSDPPKVAVTEVSECKATVHVPVPEHAPDQPPNTKPEFGVAVRVMLAPVANAEVQVWPQSIPAGFLVTVPLPEPDSEMVNFAPGAKPAATEVTPCRTKVP